MYKSKETGQEYNTRYYVNFGVAGTVAIFAQFLLIIQKILISLMVTYL